MKNIDKPNVYIRDSVRVREKLKMLYEGGSEKLQVCDVVEKNVLSFDDLSLVSIRSQTIAMDCRQTQN